MKNFENNIDNEKNPQTDNNHIEKDINTINQKIDINNNKKEDPKKNTENNIFSNQTRNDLYQKLSEQRIDILKEQNKTVSKISKLDKKNEDTSILDKQNSKLIWLNGKLLNEIHNLFIQEEGEKLNYVHNEYRKTMMNNFANNNFYKAFYLKVPDFVKDLSSEDLEDKKEEIVEYNRTKEISGKTKDGYEVSFSQKIDKKNKPIEELKLKSVGSRIELNSFGYIPIPLNEEERVKYIKMRLESGDWHSDILRNKIKKDKVKKLLESANIKIPNGLGEIGKGIVFDTEYSSFNPKLKLKASNVDVSYNYAGFKNKRETNIFTDQDGKNWYEIFKQPEKQIMISMIAKPFFNVSQVISRQFKGEQMIDSFENKTEEKGLIAKLKKRFEPEETTRYFSKEMPLKNLPVQDLNSQISDYIVFTTIFEKFNDDRQFAKQHNIDRFKDAYRLFDYDQSGIENSSTFNEDSKKSDLSYRLKEIKYHFYSEYKDSEYYGDKTLSFEIIENMTKKLEDMKTFFLSKNGEDFFHSAEEKTKGSGDYKGLLLTINANIKGILEELDVLKDKYIKLAGEEKYKKTKKDLETILEKNNK